MNQRQTYGAPHVGAHPQAPNAALLIDFDNVTVGIRSDLGKELKALLNSDIIRGKVAVQRAYADWRRYPQYIVPLAESSIDLIFAPAYGTSKKNATDLRMAVDAMEMVFTRPEIGTYILLTGDSDFSSCVLKLKEYGKYVIGVGMRESSSDLLIQNCDEYYSYHSLSGLTRTTVGGDGMREDPWTLVREAVREMVSSGDAMRPDRLKQVMLSLDPAFDEKKLGYSKFSRFVSEAAKKGLIGLKRGENGQHEILPAGAEEEAPAREPRAEERRDRDRDRDRDRRGRNGRRGGRERERERRPEPLAETSAAEEVVSAPAPTTGEVPEVVGVLEQVKGPEATVEVGDLQGAYGLLQEAVRSLVGKGGAARDGDVKRKMLEVAPEFDEGKLGFSKFSRFLRQAHDAEAIDLHRVGENSYEVSLPASGKRFAAPAATGAPAAPAPKAEPAAEAAAPSRGIGGGRRGRGRAPEGPPPVLPEQVVAAPEPVAEEAPAAKAPAAEAPAPTEEPLQVEAEAAAPAGRVSLRGRRGSRGRGGAPEGPPPVLPGQAIPSPRREEAAAAPAPAEAPAAEAAPEAAPAAEEEAPKQRRTRTRGRKKAEAPAPAPEPQAPAFSAEALGLPTDRQAIENYLTNSYKGVGKKTAEQLTESFGEEVFRVMQEQPDRVREVLGARRADNLLEQWAADHDRRVEQAAEEAELPVPAEETPQAVAEEAAAEPKRTRTRGRRGGRGRGKSKEAAEEAPAAVAAPEAAPAAEEAPAEAPKQRRTRTRKKPEAAAPEAAPEAQAAEGESEKPASRSRGRRGGRGRAKKKEPAGS